MNVLKSLLKTIIPSSKKEVKLVSLFLTQVFLIIALTFIIVLYLWIKREYITLDKKLTKTQKDYIESQKENIKKETERAIDYINYKINQTDKSLKQKLKNRVNLAYKISLSIHNENKGKLSKNEIKELIKDALKTITFDNESEYLFIGDLTGNQILYPPRPQIEGKNLYNLQDKLGNYIIRDAIKIAKEEKEGYMTNYWFSNPVDTSGESKMISYIKLFEPYDWYIGTGVYYIDFNNRVQNEVIEWLSNYRFGKEGYIFINTYDGYPLLMDGKIVREKKNLWNMEDPNGVKVIQEERKAVKNAEGNFIYYSWKKLTTDQIGQKMSFVKGVPEWRWIVGSGVYIDEINVVVTNKKNELKKAITRDILLIFIWLSILFAALYLLAVFLSRRAKSNIQSFVDFVTKASYESSLIDESKINFTEFKTFARAANKMIAEIKESEIRNQEEEAHFDKLFEGSPEAIVYLNEEGKVQRINEAFTLLFGFEQSEIIDKKIDDFIVPPELRKQALTYTEKIKNGSYEQIEAIRKTKDKGNVIVSIIGTPVTINDKMLGFYVIYRNITKQKEFEQELQESKIKAEESDRLKMSFLTNLSHEIRTPLNAIIGFSTLLNTKEVNKEDQKEYLRLLGNSGKLLLEIIDNILDLSKIESSTLYVNKIDCNINTMLDELLIDFTQHKNNMKYETVKLILNKEVDDRELYIVTDLKRLKQVFTNLLDNALKFTEEGTVEFGYYIQNQCVVCFVKDTGIGIDKNELDFIFDRFRQADESTTRRYGGTGIGLALCKSLVELLDGKLWVESKKGEGSQFYFTIPLERPIDQDQMIKYNGLENINWSNKKILIAEDVEINYKLLHTYLENTNVIIDWAKDGKQAVDMVKKNDDYDLILMDINMPNMTGHEALKKLKDNGFSIPVVAQTAFATDEQNEEMRNLGYSDYILKPITLENLFHKISKFLD